MSDILKITAGVVIAQILRPIILSAAAMIERRIRYGVGPGWNGHGYDPQWKQFLKMVMGSY